jgi:hypothetical protein
MRVSPAKLGDTSSIVSRTVLVYSQVFKMRGTWVLQPVAEIGLADVLADPALRDIFWCATLKFMRTLFLATPSAAGMEDLMGFLEPMSQGEEVLEIGQSQAG